MSIRSDGELHWQSAQKGQDFAKLRVHRIFARSEIDGPNRKTRHRGLHLFEAQAVDARRIAVAKRAGEVAFVGQAESDCKTPRPSRPHHLRLRHGLYEGLCNRLYKRELHFHLSQTCDALERGATFCM